MASLMNELLEVLENEEAGYRELVEASTRKKRKSLLKRISELWKKLLQRNRRLPERSRTLRISEFPLWKILPMFLNRKPEDLTVDALLEILANQPKEQEQLAKIRLQLKDTLTEMKNINEQNQTLVNQAMELVEFDMALLKSMRQAPETANYNRQAYNTGELLGSGGFDAKQ